MNILRGYFSCGKLAGTCILQARLGWLAGWLVGWLVAAVLLRPTNATNSKATCGKLIKNLRRTCGEIGPTGWQGAGNCTLSAVGLDYSQKRAGIKKTIGKLAGHARHAAQKVVSCKIPYEDLWINPHILFFQFNPKGKQKQCACDKAVRIWQTAHKSHESIY